MKTHHFGWKPRLNLTTLSDVNVLTIRRFHWRTSSTQLNRIQNGSDMLRSIHEVYSLRLTMHLRCLSYSLLQNCWITEWKNF